MKNLYLKRKNNLKAFTLLEILIVIALIAFVVGMGATNLGKIFSDNQQKLTGTEIATMETALLSYKMKFGSYPSTADGLQAVVKAGFLKKIPEDAWGKALQYRCPPTKSATGYDLWSLGEDGVESADDFGNWSVEEANK